MKNKEILLGTTLVALLVLAGARGPWRMPNGIRFSAIGADGFWVAGKDPSGYGSGLGEKSSFVVIGRGEIGQGLTNFFVSRTYAKMMFNDKSYELSLKLKTNEDTKLTKIDNKDYSLRVGEEWTLETDGVLKTGDQEYPIAESCAAYLEIYDDPEERGPRGEIVMHVKCYEPGQFNYPYLYFTLGWDKDTSKVSLVRIVS